MKSVKDKKFCFELRVKGEEPKNILSPPKAKLTMRGKSSFKQDSILGVYDTYDFALPAERELKSWVKILQRCITQCNDMFRKARKLRKSTSF
jgi:hypothetical protein